MYVCMYVCMYVQRMNTLMKEAGTALNLAAHAVGQTRRNLMYVCVCVYIYAYVHIYVCLCMNVYIAHACMCAQVRACRCGRSLRQGWTLLCDRHSPYIPTPSSAYS